ncbi:hypothetical protein JKP88DRAFT_248147 [Tribonema minus]|uniref:Uncharacterized protein n=1 Tax=Tribonema minus TaxID=303371 RepID=A0A836C9N8_9STRA|nr:hypothetical protein JKP88DRAFT_248147 [Tribonema minus]
MIKIAASGCRACGKSANYGFRGEGNAHCASCRAPGMIRRPGKAKGGEDHAASAGAPAGPGETDSGSSGAEDSDDGDTDSGETSLPSHTAAAAGGGTGSPDESGERSSSEDGDGAIGAAPPVNGSAATDTAVAVPQGAAAHVLGTMLASLVHPNTLHKSTPQNLFQALSSTVSIMERFSPEALE